MTIAPSTQTLGAARRLHETLAGDNLPRKIAKLYSQHTRLQQNQRGLSTWTNEEAAARLNEAVRLIDAAHIEKTAELSDWYRAMLRGAEVLEWLSHPSLNEAGFPLHLLAGAAYQLAGYPARSSSLLATNAGTGADSAILSSYLRADFKDTLHELCNYWRQKDSRSSQFSSATFVQEEIEDTLTSEVASALGLICAAMRWGDDERLQKALVNLKSVSAVFLYGRDVYSWLLARLCSDVASTYIESSLREATKDLMQTLTPIGRNALERYLRYNYLVNRSLAWKSQRHGINQLITGDSFALCTPTGSGKTTVAELAILRGLFQNTGEGDSVLRKPVALYLVPTRALAAEVEARLSRVIRRIGDDVQIAVTGLYGGTDWGPTDAWLTSDDPTVLICTYEKAEALIRFLGPLFLNRLSLLVIDEAHAINFQGEPVQLEKAESRSLRLETLCARLFAFLDTRHSQIIALSAVASGADNSIASWVSGQSGTEAIRTFYRSTRQLIGCLECANNRFRIRYDLLDGASLRFDGKEEDDTLFVPNPFPSCPAVSGFDGPEKSLRPYLFWAAMHLAQANVGDRQGTVLISVTQKPGDYAQDFLDLLDKQWKDSAPSFFIPPTNSKQESIWQECLASCADYFGKESREYLLLARGIAVHHGKMPGLMARKLVEVIQEGITHIVIATSTLTEGVNLPFDTILIPTLRRYNGNLTAQEFANLVGRAGRPGIAVEGKSLVLVPAETSDYRDINIRRSYASLVQELQHRNEPATTPQSALAELIKHLEALWHRIYKSGSTEDFEAWLERTTTVETEEANRVNSPSDEISTLDTLDSILLSAIVETEQLADEEASIDDLENHLKRIWQRSYARFASDEQSRLQHLFVQRGRAIKTTIHPDRTARRHLYRTSLPPRAAQVLLRQYPIIKLHLVGGEAYAVSTLEERLAYIQTLVTHISGMPMFTIPPLKIGNSRQEKPASLVLHWWLAPEHCPEKPTAKSVSDWHYYISQNFVYRLNWALGSVLSLAINEAHEGELRETSIQEWPETGLPWIAFWIKELITWGTLDPVAAFLLARGHTVTRSDAETKALDYYAGRSGEADANDLLHPGEIRAWVDATFGIERGRRRLHSRPSFHVNLERDFSLAPAIKWRVLPVDNHDSLYWYDPAGFLMGISAKPDWWESDAADMYDFHLDSAEKTISSKFYL